MYPFKNFFEQRDYDEFIKKRERKENIRDDVSLFTKY
jgi:hypothetical protein